MWMPPTMTTDSCTPFFELGDELIQEFLASCEDACADIAQSIELLQQGADSELIHRLFRDLHSFKGNCRMVFLDVFVEVLHRLEEFVEGMRDGRLRYHPQIGHFLNAGVQDVHEQIRQLVRQRELDSAALQALKSWVEQACQAEHLEPEQRFALIDSPASRTIRPSAAVLPEVPGDLDLMLSLGQKLDGLSIHRRGRLEQTLELAHELNLALGSPCQEDQLMAAVSLHDLGMAFVPHGIFNKEGELNRDEQRMMQGHIEIGYQLLRRMGWEEAARIVLHHHERYDGKGYPQKLVGEQIPVGSRILALIDTYSSLTSERADRNSRKSLFSAIAEINAHRSSQFDPHMIDHFNEVIRQHMSRR